MQHEYPTPNSDKPVPVMLSRQDGDTLKEILEKLKTVVSDLNVVSLNSESMDEIARNTACLPGISEKLSELLQRPGVR